MFPGGVLLEDINKTSSNGESGRGRRKLPTVIILTLAALVLLGAGYLLFNHGGNEISTTFGNVRGELIGSEYESPSEPLVPREEINIRPAVTNTGDVSIYSFITVTVPYSTVDGEIVEWYDQAPSTAWTMIERQVDEATVTYVYAYESEWDSLVVLESGQSSEPLFDDDHKLTVGAIGLLEESDRTDSSRAKVRVDYHVCQSRMMDGLSDSEVFEAILEEER